MTACPSNWKHMLFNFQHWKPPTFPWSRAEPRGKASTSLPGTAVGINRGPAGSQLSRPQQTPPLQRITTQTEETRLALVCRLGPHLHELLRASPTHTVSPHLARIFMGGRARHPHGADSHAVDWKVQSTAVWLQAGTTSLHLSFE